MAEPLIRPGTPQDVPAVARIWEVGWRDGHHGHVPEALVAARTSESFRVRALERVPATSVAEVEGAAPAADDRVVVDCHRFVKDVRPPLA